jgi:hypothetical protein
MAALPPQPPRTRDTRKRDRWIIAIVATVVVALVIILATVPVPQTYSFSFGSYGSGYSFFDFSYSQPLCPAGAKASVSYSSSFPSVTVSIVTPNGSVIWSQKSPQGNTTFTVPTCGTYQFVMAGSGSGQASISGTLSYSAPIL